MQGKSFRTELDEQIVFNQLDGDANAVWSILLATGYLKVLELERVWRKTENWARRAMSGTH